jgi:hypothetical protein
MTRASCKTVVAHLRPRRAAESARGGEWESVRCPDVALTAPLARVINDHRPVTSALTHPDASTDTSSPANHLSHRRKHYAFQD